MLVGKRTLWFPIKFTNFAFLPNLTPDLSPGALAWMPSKPVGCGLSSRRSLGDS